MLLSVLMMSSSSRHRTTNRAAPGKIDQALSITNGNSENFVKANHNPTR